MEERLYYERYNQNESDVNKGENTKNIDRAK